MDEYYRLGNVGADLYIGQGITAYASPHRAGVEHMSVELDLHGEESHCLIEPLEALLDLGD